ncbi:hypothetical protein T484DRAFT_1854220 [Baffinella frigidus]|nr:hypothetical protein T484DRAFT_1854220 [Cryptophyta sp. CCMP2293]
MLRERNFGELELGDHARYKEVWAEDEYKEVWAEDETDATHHTFQAESPAEVRARLVALVEDLEGEHQDKVRYDCP